MKNIKKYSNLYFLAGVLSVFMLPALFNGFPFVGEDSALYLYTSLTGKPGPLRTSFYSLIMTPFVRTGFFQGIVILQSLAVTGAFWVFLKTFDVGLSKWYWLPVSILSTIWIYTGSVMADFSVTVWFFGLYVLVYGQDKIGIRTRIAITVLTAIAIAFHAASTYLAGGFLICLFLCNLIYRLKAQYLTAMLAVIISIVSQYAVDTMIVGEKGNTGYAWGLAASRITHDDPDFLPEFCKTKSGVEDLICDNLDELEQYRGIEYWLVWNQLIALNGGVSAIKVTAREITVKAWSEDTMKQIGFIAEKLRIYFFNFETSFPLVAYDLPKLNINRFMTNFMPEYKPLLDKTLQQTGFFENLLLRLEPLLQIIHNIAIALVIAGCLPFFGIKYRRIHALCFSIFILVLANDILFLALTDPNPRYHLRFGFIIMGAAMYLSIPLIEYFKSLRR